MRIDCICPLKGTDVRHPDGDEVDLRPTLDFIGAMTVRRLIGLREDGDSTADVMAAIDEAYLCYGIGSWSVVDVQGKPVPVSRDAIRARLGLFPLAFMPVADAAHELYSEEYVLPLLSPGSTSSRRTRTGASTSPPNGSSTPQSRGRSRRSSTTTSRTEDTATISPSPAGDSSS